MNWLLGLAAAWIGVTLLVILYLGIPVNYLPGNPY